MKQRAEPATHLRSSAWACLAWAGGLVAFRWDVFSTGFSRISTSAGDGRAVLFLLEHWFLVFKGEAVWLDPGQYFPAKGTLGYYDAHFLQALLYVPLRAMGLDRFLAFQVEQILLSAIGFAGFWLVCRSLLAAPVAISVIGCLLFTFSSSLHASTPQSQLFSVYFVPWLALALARAYRLRSLGPRGTFGWSFLAGLGYALLLYTSFYIGWFVGIAALVLVASLAVIEPATLLRLSDQRRSLMPLALGGMVGFLAGLVPFARTYFPVVAAGRSQTVETALSGIGHLTDLVNVGARNWLWGPWLVAIPGYPAERLWNPNFYRTITPLVLATVLCAGIPSILHRRAGSSGAGSRSLRVLTLTIVVLLVLSISVGGHSVWPLLWKYVPGGKAIRFPWRLQILNAALAAAAVTLALTAVVRWGAGASGPRRRSAFAAASLGAILVAEQFSGDRWIEIDRRADAAMLSALPTPPRECRAFAMVDDVGVVRVPNMFALLVAQQVKLPTLNGPEGALYPDARVEVLDRPTLLGRAKRWLGSFDWPEGVCVLDLPTSTWDTAALARPSPVTIPADTRVSLSRSGQTDLLVSGWSDPEDWGTWSVGQRAVLRFRTDRIPKGALRVDAGVTAFVYGAHKRQETVASVAGQEVARWVFDGWRRRCESIAIPASLIDADGVIEIAFANLATASPKSVDLSDDARDLGVAVSWIRVTTGDSECGQSAP